MKRNTPLYRAPGRTEGTETVVECVAQYIDDYWAQQHAARAWEYLGLPLPVMDEVIQVAVLDPDDETRVIDEIAASVEDEAQMEVRGEIINVFRQTWDGPGTVTILEPEHEGGGTTTARFGQTMSNSVNQGFGKNVVATVVDMGDGPRLTDIEVLDTNGDEGQVRGYFKYRGEPWITVRVLVPTRQLESHVDFLISTGAAGTTLMPHDAERLGLDLNSGDLVYRHWQRRPGQTVRAADVAATIAFLPERGAPIRQEVTLRAAHPDERGDDQRPSVLGMDALWGMLLEISPERGITLTRSQAAGQQDGSEQ